MPENQLPQTQAPQETTPITPPPVATEPTPNTTTENTIDFSKFSISETTPEVKQENPLETQTSNTNTSPIQEAQNMIAQLNQIKEEKTAEVEIEHLNIKAAELKDQTQVELGTSGVNERVHKSTTANELQTLMVAYIILIIGVIGIVLVNLYGTYFNLASQATSESDLSTYRDISRNISKYTSINNYDNLLSNPTLLTENNARNNLDTIINNQSLNYIQKKDIIQNSLGMLSTDIMSNANNLENQKKDINKYGFIPKELYDTIQGQQGIGNIRKSMLLIENIRFITAFKAFSYMESFLQSLANTLGKDPLDIEQKIASVNEEAEKAMITYTNNCYFNPYEITYDCDITNDFDNYYKLIDTKSKTDTTFIKKLASYVDMKLQQTDIPTFSVNFGSFDPKQDNVKISMDLNTNSQDELALSKQGVINPHLYIVTNLINLLKQSLLVIGENIKADQIRISPKTIRVGTTIFTVNNSVLEFTLPIQKQNQREISDFFSIPN